MGAPSSAATTGDPTSRNEVLLRGRISGLPEQRTLPSGDVIATLRVVTQRDASAGPTVDTIDCVARRAGIRRTFIGARPGDVAELTGALRRRFWRTGNGVASRYEVEVATCRIIERAGRPTTGGRATRRRVGEADS
jgi:single-strand DNA-binding protein